MEQDQAIKPIKCWAEEIRSVNEDGTERVDVIIHAPMLSVAGKKVTEKKEDEHRG